MGRLVLFFAFLYGLFGCELTSEVEQRPIKLEIEASDIDSEFVLGRVLFYDQQLSVNNSISCGSCHKQVFAFADNVAFSNGFENRPTFRNSMAIQDLPGGRGFFLSDFFDSEKPSRAGMLFWDGRESNLSELVLKPIANHREMGVREMNQLIEKLQSIDYYQTGFKNVFGSEDVSLERISLALTDFVTSIKSNNTKFDQVLKGEAEFTASELHGRNLFIEKYDCNSCHQVQHTNGYISGGLFSNIGLDVVDEDIGLGSSTGLKTDNGKFRIPSLRNVALTAPYMHDGRFETLEEVIDHYSTGLNGNENLDIRLKNFMTDQPLFLNITESEKKSIVAFLNTLTDYTMISDPDLSNPFSKSN